MPRAHCNEQSNLHSSKEINTVSNSSVSDQIYIWAASAGGNGQEGAQTFLDSSAGQTLTTLLGAIGVIVLIVGGLLAIKGFVSGKIGAGIKVLVGTVVICAILFAPDLLLDAVSGIGSLLGKAFDSFGSMT